MHKFHICLDPEGSKTAFEQWYNLFPLSLDQIHNIRRKFSMDSLPSSIPLARRSTETFILDCPFKDVAY